MFVSVLGQTAEEEERKIVGFRSRQSLVIGDLKEQEKKERFQEKSN